MRVWWLGPVLALAGCGSDGGGGADSDSVSTGTNGGDADTDADTDTDEPATGCYDVPISLVGGYGAQSETFLELHDGDPVQITHGPQGGWHIETALRVEHTHQTMTLVPTVTVVSTGQQISGVGGTEDANYAYVLLAMDGDCSGSFLGLRAYLDDVDPDPEALETLDQICQFDGQELEIAWTATDLVDQRVGTTSVRVIAQMDPADVSPTSDLPTCMDYD